MKKEIVYKASDGKTFEAVKECRAYERATYSKRLAGLKPSAIQAALDGQDQELAMAIKKVGNMMPLRIREVRRSQKAAAEALADPTGDKAGELLAQQLEERKASAMGGGA
jgi:hypothetical protein